MSSDSTDRVCPTCADEFRSKAAMYAHHSCVHGESLRLNRLETAVCVGCECEFEFDPQHQKGKLCVSCAKQFPGAWTSSTMMKVVERMEPEDLRAGVENQSRGDEHELP